MTELLSSGVELMLIGMGTVFAFLTLLIAATTGMSMLVAQLPSHETPATVDTPSSEPTAEELAVIAAAVARYRQG